MMRAITETGNRWVVRPESNAGKRNWSWTLKIKYARQMIGTISDAEAKLGEAIIATRGLEKMEMINIAVVIP